MSDGHSLFLYSALWLLGVIVVILAYLQCWKRKEDKTGARREVGARAPAARAPRVGGARRNQNVRARSKRARRLQAQVAVEGAPDGQSLVEAVKESTVTELPPSPPEGPPPSSPPTALPSVSEGSDASSSKEHVLHQSVQSREGYAVLLRKHVSRNSAGKGRAVLEGVGLTTERIRMCYSNHSSDEEEAVQSGLTEWSEGRYNKPTWKVLLNAMGYAGIGCQLIDNLKAELLNKTVSEGSQQELEEPVPPSAKPLRDMLGSYYSKGCVPDHPLLASSNMQHVRLNLVQPEQLKPMAGRAEEAVSVQLAKGGAGQVPLSKTTIKYTNILTFPPSPVMSRKRVLIEGVPGSGKSTLVQRMCHDWSVSGFAHDYELVIQVTLRSLPKDQKLSLEDLIYTTVADEVDIQKIVRYVSLHKGAGVLFVFDGYDEMSEEMRQKSIVCDILDGRFAPLSSFVITSRPISAGSLYSCVDRRVEICGFGDEEVKDYITKYYVSNPAAGKKLLSTLSTRPNIKRLCCVPLLLMMICYSAAHGGDIQGIPPTMHQLYVDIIIHTVNYNLKREGKKMYAGSLEDVMELCPSFAKLADLALNKIGTDTIIFSNLNFEVDEALLGLINCIQSQTRFGTTTRTWHFLHRTLQEFMAGLAMAKKPPEEQVLFWRKHLSPKYDKEGRFVLGDDNSKSMFLFYCGVSGLSNPGIQSMLLDTLDAAVEPTISRGSPLAELCEVVSESGNEEFAHSILSVCGTTVDIHDPKFQGSGWVVGQYCKRVEGVRLSIGEGFPFFDLSNITSQLESICSLAAVHLPRVSIDLPPAPVDIDIVKQFLLRQKCLKSFTLTVSSRTQLDKVEKTLISLCKDVILHHKNSLEEVAVSIPLDPLVPALVVCQKMAVLKLHKARLSRESMLTTLEDLSKLQELVLENVSVEDIDNRKAVSDFELNLTKQVQDHPSLKALTIKEECRMLLFKGAVAGMSKRGSVEKLVVTGLHFTDEMVPQVAHMMKTGCLKVLEFRVTSSQCMRLLKELPHCTCLQTFGVTLSSSCHEEVPVGVTASSCTAALLKAVSECVSLEEVVLRSCSFDGIDDTVEEFAKHLKHSKLMKLTILKGYELSPFLIAALCRGLHWSRSLEELHIQHRPSQGNDVSDPVTLQAVEVAVRENTSLRKMVISPIKRSKKLNVNEMTCTNVAEAILKGATKNATLRTLRLGVPAEPLPSQQLIPADLRRSKSKLQLLVWAGDRFL